MKKAIIIHGWESAPEDLGLDGPTNFVLDPFDWERIRLNANNFVVLNQINDPWVPFSVGKEMAKNLGVEVIKVPGDNHFDTMDLELLNKEII